MSRDGNSSLCRDKRHCCPLDRFATRPGRERRWRADVQAAQQYGLRL